MADREHSIAYIINASVGSGFQSTFTKAQSEFTRLGKEIQNVQKIQRDVSAYQRQEKAVQNTGAKLENLKQQYALLETQIEQTREPTAALEREKLKLQQRIDDTALALERQNSKLNATEQRLKDAGISTDDLTGADAKLTGQIAELRAEQDKAAQSAENYTETASSGFADVGQALASAGIIVGLKKIADAYADCVQTSAGFEGAMSRVAALSGASQGELEALSNKAKEMGAATQYTAQESAEAFGYMALAGWNAEQMLSGIAPVLNLAAASAMDLGQASDIVTDYLTAFGLGAGDAARFVDQMAYAQAHSNTTTAALGEAYKNAAATAHSLGYSVEDTTAVLMAMANAGVKGSEAGSGLSTIMTRLATNTKNCDDELGKFGVRVYDENGKMRGLTDIVWDTARAFDGLSDQEQANLAKAIAGTNQYAKLQTILAGMSESAKAGGQSIADYADALDNCSGAAGKMADTMLDNLTGDLTRLDSAVDAVKISLGEQFTPELRKLAQTGTDVLSGVNRFIERNPATVKGLTVATGAVGTLTAGVVGLSAAIKLVKTLELGTVFGGAVPQILAVGAGISALIGFLEAAKTDWEDTIASAIELEEAVGALNQTLDKTTIRSIEGEAQANAAAAEAYLARIDELGAVQNRTEEQELRYQGALAGLLEVAPDLSDFISQTADEYGRVTYAVKGTTDAMWANIDAMKQQAIMDSFQEQLRKIADGQADVIVKIELAKINRQDFSDQKDELLRQQQALINEIDAASTGSLDESAFDVAMLQSRMEDLEGQINYTDGQIEKYNKDIEDANDTLAEADKETLAFNNAIDAQAEKIGIAKDGADEFSASMDGVSESAEGALGPLDTVTEQIAKLSEAYAEAYEAALTSVRGQYNLWDEAEEIVPSSLDKIGQALDSQAANWTARLENLDLLSAYEGQIEGLSGLLDSLALDNSKEGVNLLAGLADSVRQGEGGIKKLEEFAGKYTTLQEKQEEYAGKAAELKVDLATANEELLEAIDESIAGMDRSHDAENAAHATIQAYIDEANNPDNLSAIRSAWGKAAGEAVRALSEMHDPLSRGSVGGLTPTAILRYEEAHAEGGILTQPHIGLVAEDGPEAVIPLSAARRDRGAEIWEEAGRRMGLLNATPAAESTKTAGWAVQAYESGTQEAAQPLAPVSFIWPHVEGGILTVPHIGLVAEDGPEAVIPLSASRRDRGAEIWQEAGQRLSTLAADSSPGTSAMLAGHTDVPLVGNGAGVSLADRNNETAAFTLAMANAAQTGPGAAPAVNIVNAAPTQTPAMPRDAPALSLEMSQAVLEAATSAQNAAMEAEPLEAMPSPDSYGAPAHVEIHIHLEAGVSAEAVEALDDLVRRGELEAAVLAAVENAEQDRKRLAFA